MFGAMEFSVSDDKFVALCVGCQCVGVPGNKLKLVASCRNLVGLERLILRASAPVVEIASWSYWWSLWGSIVPSQCSFSEILRVGTSPRRETGDGEREHTDSKQKQWNGKEIKKKEGKEI